MATSQLDLAAMRIGFLTHEPFFPPSGGGSAEAVYLVRDWVRRGHQVTVYCPKLEEPERVAAQFGVRLVEFRGWKMGRYARWRNFKYLAYPNALRRLVEHDAKEHRPDLFLSQHTISAVAAVQLRRRLGVPVVLNFLDYLTGFMETWPVWAMPPIVLRRLNRFEMALPRRHQVEGVMTVSTPLAERFAATGYPSDRICAIQYGYDSAMFSAPKSGTLWPDPPVVVMHGSFDQHHLGPIALEAVTRVARQRSDIRFRFVGRETSTLKAFANRLRQNGVPAASIETTGFVPYERVGEVLRGATLGIVPYEESDGTHCAFVAKAVEYLGSGLPVVSTPLENLRRYFATEQAIRFSEFSGESFAKRILEWLDTPGEARRQLGLAASLRVQSELDWSAVATRASEFLERIFGATKRPVGANPRADA